MPVSPLTFSMQVLDNPKVSGVTVGSSAMRAAGAQPEFIAHNIAQANGLGSSLILRAGAPPQYNKHRGPKSGVNLTKTSTQGFFKGTLVEDSRFARIQKDAATGEAVLLAHNSKDEAHLTLKVYDPDYQHRMQLDLNMQDILREVGPKGDLRVLGYDAETGMLRFEYKEGKGPPRDKFDGQFVINLLDGDDTPQFFSRPWDAPEHQPDWDAKKGVISKPEGLNAIPDEVYEKVFRQSFKLNYTNDKAEQPKSSDVHAANVFANRPRTASEFLNAMGREHPQFESVKHLKDLNSILSALSRLENGEDVILSVYNKAGVIVAGDWDGLALGHPPTIDSKYKVVYNTFDPVHGIDNMQALMTSSQEYLDELKATANAKPLEQQTTFDKQLLSLKALDDPEMVSDFARARAGCITPHEFVFQQVLNCASRDRSNSNYGESYNKAVIQSSMDDLLSQKFKKGDMTSLELHTKVRETYVRNLGDAGPLPSSTIIDQVTKHIAQHLEVAIKKGNAPYRIPHPQHDVNVHDLYQHGFDMRNPYGSNLEGPWLMVNPDGGVLYGETQEQLIDVLLTSDYLEKNHMDINWGADMNAGWDRIIARQLELKQTVPPQTLISYAAHLKTKELEVANPEVGLKIKEAIEVCRGITKPDDFVKKYEVALTRAPLAPLTRAPLTPLTTREPLTQLSSRAPLTQLTSQAPTTTPVVVKNTSKAELKSPQAPLTPIDATKKSPFQSFKNAFQKFKNTISPPKFTKENALETSAEEQSSTKAKI